MKHNKIIVTIRIRNTDPKDGPKIFKVIARNLHLNRRIIISFRGIDDINLNFLNYIFGQLYRDFSKKKIKDNINIINVNHSSLALMQRAIETGMKQE